MANTLRLLNIHGHKTGPRPDLLLNQETNLSKGRRHQELDNSAQLHYNIHYNNLSKRVAGVSACVARKLDAYYSTHHTIVQEGYISLIQLKPRQGWEHLGELAIVNFYGITNLEVARKYKQAWKSYDHWLEVVGGTDSLWRRKQHQIHLLKLACAPLTNTHTVILGGDFNFVLDQADRSGGTSTVTNAFLSEWESLCSLLHITEVYQPSHTYFAIGKEADNYQSSRLDRWYVNTSPTKQTEACPLAYIPHIPYSITTTYHNKNILLSLQDTDKERITRDFGSSNIHPHDHLPVCLDITRQASSTTSNAVPEWAYSLKSFATLLTDRWTRNKRHKKYTHFRRLKLLKKFMKTTAKKLMRDTTQARSDTENEGAKLTVGIKLLHDTSRLGYGPDFIWEYQQRHKFVAALKLKGEHGHDREVVLAFLGTLFNKEVARKAANFEELDFTHLGTPRQDNKLRQLSKKLPNDRAQLTRLQLVPGGEVLSDPDAIAGEAASYWRKHWSYFKVPASKIEEWLSQYQKKVRGVAKEPELKDMTEGIMGTNNSTVGPDTIPFSAYRGIAELASSVLLGVQRALSRGLAPPAGFNHGRLFLIPKDSTILIQKTRPITVPNTDNRIISSLIRQSITPMVDRLVNHAQTALTGRKIGQNIMEFNEQFYENVDRRKQSYLLFLDFEKAFDNVSHAFIHAVLKKAGFPAWFRHSVKGLLHGLGAFTCVPGAQDIFIPVRKGLKQGCPLSPLLYAILIDPLIERLLAIREGGGGKVKVKGYVDDIGLGFKRIDTVDEIAQIVQDHSEAAGGRINQGKTHLLSTREFTDNDRTVVGNSRWNNLLLSQKAVYLGILFGRNVTIEQVYDGTLEKARKRARKYMALRRYFSFHDRILIANVFLISMLSYITQWFIIPDKTRRNFNELVKRFVVPFSSVSQQALTNPPEFFGLKRRLRDITYMNLAAMHKAYSRFSQLKRLGDGFRPSSLFKTNGRRNPDARFDASNMRIHLQVIFAYHCSRLDDNTIEVPDNPEDRMTSKEVYDKLLHSEYSKNTAIWYIAHKLNYFVHRPEKQGVSNKVEHHFPADTSEEERIAKAGIIVQNTKTLPSSIPDYVRWVLIRIIFHGLPTARRLRLVGTAEHPAHLDPTQACFLCGCHRDETPHIFLDCDIVALALRELSLAELGHQVNRGLGNLLFTVPLAKENVQFLTYFNAAVWLARSHVKHFGITGSVVNVIKHQYQCVTRKTGFQYGQRCTGKQNQAAQKRRRQSAARKVADTLGRCSNNDLIFFGDGGANPNPGPSGAGLALYHRQLTYKYNRPLGYGTNQVGEIFALGMGFEILDQMKSQNRIPEQASIHIFLDSTYALSHGQDSYKIRANRDLILLMKQKRDSLGALASRIKYHWCPGHEDIEGNDLADKLATMALEAARNDSSYDHGNYVRQGGFLPPGAEAFSSHYTEANGTTVDEG